MYCGQHSPQEKQGQRWFQRCERRWPCLLFVCYIFAGCSIYDSDLLGRQSAVRESVTTPSMPWADRVALQSDSGKPNPPDMPWIQMGSDAEPARGAQIATADAGANDTDAGLPEDVCSEGNDCCPNDPNKTAPGKCGCGVPDVGDDCELLAPRKWLRRLTFDSSQIAGVLEDFPVLVHITDAHLGVFAASNAQDLRFLAADSSTTLAHEIERFHAARGELTTWVRVPRLAPSSDLVLYLAYGDGEPYPERADEVWHDHHHVWHLTAELDEGNTQVADSTARAHAQAAGAMSSANTVAGIAGDALQFDGRDDMLCFQNDLLGATPSTIQAWVIQRRRRPGSSGSGVVMLGEQAPDRARFLLSERNEMGAVRYGFYENDLGFAGIPHDVWRHLVWTWDGSRSALYIDGELVEGPSPHPGADTRGEVGCIGGAAFDAPRYDFFHAGTLDEVRISTVVRSREWVATEYANQRPGSTFLKTIGEPEPAL